MRVVLCVCAVFIVLTASVIVSGAAAQQVPGWVKGVALLYGQDLISESEFLAAMGFLIKNGIIVIEAAPEPGTFSIVIPNGNAEVANAGFYIPLNAQVAAGTEVVWINEDAVPHTIQSQDERGNIIGLFNSNVLETGQRFTHVFGEEGTYNYYCTLHPWRIGLVTVT